MEKTLNISLNELDTIRLVCQQEDCGGVASMPVSRLEALTGAVLCPSCARAFKVEAIGAVGGLKALGMALRNLSGNELNVEFVVPDPDI